ncbi:MAG: DNA translocase FtsK, partial [Clostridia bacterium]|nr:DNA translocase FtsK [Clostridia bacterium]
LPWYDRGEEIPPIGQEAGEVEQTKLPLPRMRAGAVSSARHTSGEARQVHTDPAVPLTGERVAIRLDDAKGPKEDPFAAKHTAEAIRQIEGKYEAPPLTLLREPKLQRVDTTAEDNERAEVLKETLAKFNIGVSVEYVVHGPAITRFALKLADGVNVNRLNNLSNNLAMSMKAVGLRLEIPIPGTNLVGIEVPNEKVSMVTLKEVLDSPAMRANPSPTAVAIGKDITGTPILCELSDMPHLLIAGATGSGKSVCINSIIQSILYRATPQQVRMIMIDPKLVELQPYNGIPHLLTEVVSEPKKAAAALDWLVQEMSSRYTRFQQAGVRNIAGYNKKMANEADRMPDIVAIIDEFSDLMVQCRKQVEESIQRLAALARAAGIYLIVATQRPSVDVITGVIKANIPSRIAFAVANNVDSRTIIDSVGAEKLLGKGDMLYFPRSEFRPIRVQGCFVSDGEVQEIADYVKEHNDALYDARVDEHMEKATQEEEQQASGGKEPDYEYQADTENEMLQKAIAMAVESGQMSISMLRRRLGLGHSRAGKLIDTMAQMGIVSQDEGPKPRRTLITREDYLKMQAEIMDQ